MRKNPQNKPKFDDFKGKTKEILQKYDTQLLRFVYEEVYNKTVFHPKNRNFNAITKQIYTKLKKNNLSLLHLKLLVEEIQEYLMDSLFIHKSQNESNQTKVQSN